MNIAANTVAWPRLAIVTQGEPNDEDARVASDFAEFGLDKATVASLSPLEIARMTRTELIAAIRAAHIPAVSDDVDERLQFLERWTLERFVYVARNCCRNQGY